MSGSPLKISQDLFRAMIAHATQAFPYECCGWLTGLRDGDTVSGFRPCENAHGQTSHVVESASARTQETAYVIAGDDLKELAETYDRSDTPPRIIYHSHPNGRAYFSDTDQLAAAPFGTPSYELQHVVIGVTTDGVTEAAQFDWDDESESYVEIARFTREDLPE